jgi:hypothetical protein
MTLCGMVVLAANFAFVFVHLPTSFLQMDGKYKREEYRLLKCDAVYFGRFIQMFRRHLLPPSRQKNRCVGL